jgi:hypothetical protein
MRLKGMKMTSFNDIQLKKDTEKELFKRIGVKYIVHVGLFKREDASRGVINEFIRDKFKEKGIKYFDHKLKKINNNFWMVILDLEYQ